MIKADVWSSRITTTCVGAIWQDAGDLKELSRKLILVDTNTRTRTTRFGLRSVSRERDPHLVFALASHCSGPGVVWFEIDEKSSNPNDPTVYLDFGQGFHESIRLSLTGDGRLWHAYMPDTDGLLRIRFDPSERACRLLLRKAAVSLLPAAEANRLGANLRLHRLSNLDVDFRTGRMQFVGDDPQLAFVVSPNLAHLPLVALHFGVSEESESSISPKLYLSPNEAHSIKFERIGRGAYRAILVMPGAFRELRLDPAEAPGVCQVTKLLAAPLTLEEEASVENVLRKDRPSAFAHPDYSVNMTLRLNPGPNRVYEFENLELEVVSSGKSHSTATRTFHTISYEEWRSNNDVSQSKLALQRRIAETMPSRPKLSLIVPVYKVDSEVFEALVASVRVQSYHDWELCITLSYHDDSSLTRAVESAALSDARIKLRLLETNGGIASNSNAALQLATGSYIVLLDHDDVIAPDALFEIANAIRVNPGVDLVYSDKDMIEQSGLKRMSPLFKPEWSPDMMLSVNYLTHLNALRASRVQEIGGWDTITDGAQDWDIFLRAIALGGRVHHIPRVLYHWRIVPTSVASGGVDVKPYAAEGQLESVRRFLKLQGWRFAEPHFSAKNVIKVDWGAHASHGATIIVLGGAGEAAPWIHGLPGATVVRLTGELDVAALNKTIEDAATELVVLMPAGLEPLAGDWLMQITGPLDNETVGIVTGKLLGQRSQVVDCGWVISEGEAKPLFRNLDRYAYTYFGSVDWTRNLAGASFAGMAFRKNDWHAIGGFVEGPRPDLAFSARIRKALGRRIFYNPFSEGWLTNAETPEDLLGLSATCGEVLGPERTLFFNQNLRIGALGQIECAGTPPQMAKNGHDYNAEAGYVATTYDYTPDLLATSIDLINQLKLPAHSQRRLLWIVPAFTMPFYGGIMTILRAAEFMRVKHQIEISFVSVGDLRTDAVRLAIAEAFPTLAAAAHVLAVREGDDLNELSLGLFDAAICTLWTTAYSLLRFRGTKEKLYFVQDYEPLFYPAGTTSSIVEATYRFGFRAICNTEPLAELYRAHGGEAEYFIPAVDTDVFHVQGRVSLESERSVTVFSYARPGHPRNCFEIVSAGLADAKRKLGASRSYLHGRS